MKKTLEEIFDEAVERDKNIQELIKKAGQHGVSVDVFKQLFLFAAKVHLTTNKEKWNTQ